MCPPRETGNTSGVFVGPKGTKEPTLHINRDKKRGYKHEETGCRNHPSQVSLVRNEPSRLNGDSIDLAPNPFKAQSTTSSSRLNDNPQKPKEWESKQRRTAIGDRYTFQGFLLINAIMPVGHVELCRHYRQKCQQHRRQMEEQHRDACICDDRVHLMAKNRLEIFANCNRLRRRLSMPDPLRGFHEIGSQSCGHGLGKDPADGPSLH